MRNVLSISLLVLLLASCDDHRLGEVLTTADSLLVEHGDSALHYLEAHEPLKAEGSRSQRMRFDLLRASAQNKAYVDFTSDSVMKEVVDYYDHHGTANDQLQAHYLLGCVYRDLGDAPRAIECFLDAVAKADTTARECDYRTMGNIYAQMAEIYHKQLLLSNEIEARKKASHFTFTSGDTLGSISDLKLLASPYIIINYADSAEIILKSAMDLYQKGGYYQDGLKTSTMLMSLYSEQPSRQKELKELIDRFEAECNLFDEHHELPPSKRQYYYYKGRYYEGINELDSAEHCFRKIYRPNMTYMSLNPMYKGLLSVYQKKQLSDSIAKYANLYCMSVDSSTILKDRDITAQMAASYNYSLYQKEALDNAKTANHRLLLLVILLSVAIIVLIVAAVLWRQYKNKQKALEQMEHEYSEVRDNYNRTRRKMKELDARHKQLIEAVHKENVESQGIITMLNSQHEEEKERLTRQLHSDSERIEQLERQLKITQYKEASVPFLNLGIVKRVKMYAKDNQHQLSENDISTLANAVKEYFPDLTSDLDGAPAITPLARNVCLLTMLNLRPGDIVTLLGISSSQVSNLRKDVNMALFNENTTRTLYQNLTRRYKILSS